MPRSAVLVLANHVDPHIQRVTDLLSERGAVSLVLDSTGEKGLPRLSYCLGRQPDERSAGWEGEFVALDEVTAVWWRPKPTFRQLQESCFRDREWQYALESLEHVIPDARWVNPRIVERQLRYKPNQLVAAQRAGLETPPTIVSNDAHVIHKFLREFGDWAIYKGLSWYYGGTERVLYTHRIAVDQILQYAANIAAAPGIFQPYIEKQYELRVTVVDTEIFAARISSQDHDETMIDWRRNPGVISYQAVTLPPEITQRLMEFHRTQGLVYAAYDFIVTPDGRHIFLEVNSAGQWLWLEETAGLDISSAIATSLLRSSGPVQASQTSSADPAC